MKHPLPALRTLEAFEAAFRLRGYSRAGNELGVTHGAISLRMKELEEFVGCPLFYREGNDMLPTDEARRLVPQIREALAILRETFPRTSGRKEETLCISVLPSFASRWLVSRLGFFRQANPDIRVYLDARLELAQLGPGGVDAAVRYGGGDWPHVRAERLAGEMLFPVCSPNYRDRQLLAHPHDLEHCVLLRHSWQPWAPWFKAAGIDLPERGDSPTYADAGLLVQAAVSGEGVALVRGLLAKQDLDAGRLISLWNIRIPDTSAYFLVRPDTVSPKDETIDTFRDWLAPLLRAYLCDGADVGGR